MELAVVSALRAASRNALERLGLREGGVFGYIFQPPANVENWPKHDSESPAVGYAMCLFLAFAPRKTGWKCALNSGVTEDPHFTV